MLREIVQGQLSDLLPTGIYMLTVGDLSCTDKRTQLVSCSRRRNYGSNYSFVWKHKACTLSRLAPIYLLADIHWTTCCLQQQCCGVQMNIVFPWIYSFKIRKQYIVLNHQLFIQLIRERVQDWDGAIINVCN